MPRWFDDNKRALQFLLLVQCQDSLEFGMYSVLGGRQNAKIDDSRAAALHEDERPEITVARHE
jgi:hypothetical protein